MSFSVFEKIDPSCQNGSMEKAKNIPYHQRPYASIAERTLVDISIYSPRPQIAGTGHSHSKISIHSPRMGRDSESFGSYSYSRDFNPLSPHGERPPVKLRNKPSQGISIHSPHTGRDQFPMATVFSPRMSFQSTLPAWGETFKRHLRPFLPVISIHSPRMGRDEALRAEAERRKDISIHSPRMGRDAAAPLWAEFREISIHSPRMGRDSVGGVGGSGSGISIHSPRMGRDGRRSSDYLPVLDISIHSPRMGRDSKRTQLFEEKNWRICTTLYLFASKGVLPADKKTF